MSIVMLAVAGTLFLFAIIVSWRRKKRSSSKDDTACGDGKPSSKPLSRTPPPGQDYEVFLSFRGVDTRKGSTDHLYNKLNDAGVSVFKDNKGLHVGEKIGPELIKAIEASKISIPVISQNYASSEWCLRELVQILECKKTGQIVLPVFYKVTPSDIQNQTGEFGQAFQQLLCQKKYGSVDVQEWRKTLRDVASLKGLELEKIADGHEAVLVKVVLKEVLKKLQKTNLVVDDYLIGVQDHMEMIKKMVDSKASSEVGVILIHGMGGIGKTTLAKLMYNQFSTQYDHRSFFSNVRERSLDERGTVELQKQLISDVLGQTSAKDIACIDAGINIIQKRFRNKKVFILLDDVNHTDQLNALARESGWFEPGSLLIITSRDKDILKKWDKKLTYGLNHLDLEQSFQLFCFYAFGREGACQSELENIARKIVLKTGGLPLAIKVIGSQLSAKDKEVWEDTLKRLMETPNDDVMKILKISYDFLKHEAKQIFLDIACFAFQIEKEFAYYVWDACKLYPHLHVKSLISLSLIKIGDEGKLIMHDQLRDLGKTIVREESSNNLKRHSRLWNREDVWKVLNEIQGTEKVEALDLAYHEETGECRLTSEHFNNLTELRLLFLERASIDGDFNNLLRNLHWLKWRGCDSLSMGTMPINFHPRKLVVLDFKNVPITEQWSGWSQIEVVQKLRVVKLVSCDKLTTTPDFSTFKEIEILIIEDCLNLIKIHPSIGKICKTLKALNVSNCEKLEKLPAEVGKMEKLKQLIVNSKSMREIPISAGSRTEFEILSATYCSSLSKLPDSIGSFINLHTMSLFGCTSLTEIPASIGELSALSELNLSNTNVVELPESIGNLGALTKLDLSYSNIKELPESIGKLRALSKLDLSNSNIKGLPESIGNLGALSELDLSNLNVEKLPESIGNMGALSVLNLLSLSIKELPNSIGNLGALSQLDLSNSDLQELPESIGNLGALSQLDLSNSDLQELPKSIGNLGALSQLDLSNSDLQELPESIGNLGALSKLDLSNTYIKGLPKSIGDLEALSELDLLNLLIKELPKSIGNLGALSLLNLCHSYMEKLPESIGNLRALSELDLSDSNIKELPESIGNLEALSKLDLSNSAILKLPESIGDLHNLEELNISDTSIERLTPAIGKLRKLQKLIAHFFLLGEVPEIGELTCLQHLSLTGSNISCLPASIHNMSSLQTLKLKRCQQLTSLPDLPRGLKELELSKCTLLRSVRGIDQLTSLETLRLKKLPRLKILRDLSHLKKLEELHLFDCKMLSCVEGTSQLTSLKELFITKCPKIENIKDSVQPHVHVAGRGINCRAKFR